MKDLLGKWALVTGASSGFGVEFAKLLAERNANLVLVARRTEPMEQLAEELRKKHSVQVVVIGMDLSRSDAGAELKVDLDTRGIAIEILVNNAGFGIYGDFLDQPLEKITEMMRLNIMTVTELTHAFGRDMARRHAGHILLVASLLGYQGFLDMPLMLRAKLMSSCWVRRCIGNSHLTAYDSFVPGAFGYRVWRDRRPKSLVPSEVIDDGT